jgi:hypothetical protein
MIISKLPTTRCSQIVLSAGSIGRLFDSFFEGGNLDCVMKVGEREYDCFMRVDSNTSGHLQWFNFKVKWWKKLGQVPLHSGDEALSLI